MTGGLVSMNSGAWEISMIMGSLAAFFSCFLLPFALALTLALAASCCACL